MGNVLTSFFFFFFFFFVKSNMEATSVEDEGTGGGIDSLVASIVTEEMGEVMMDNEAFWTK